MPVVPGFTVYCMCMQYGAAGVGAVAGLELAGFRVLGARASANMWRYKSPNHTVTDMTYIYIYICRSIVLCLCTRDVKHETESRK